MRAAQALYDALTISQQAESCPVLLSLSIVDCNTPAACLCAQCLSWYTPPLPAQDPTLLCVSSWNDHGQKAFVSDPERVVRSDFFPGLGWMLRRETWTGLSSQWCVKELDAAAHR